MLGNAEILLRRRDGAFIMQRRDNKPGITNPGMITAFGGHIEPGEQPLDTAVREINEETNLQLRKSDLRFLGHYRKTKAVHGEDWDVYYFIADNITEKGLQVYEGEGYVIIRNKKELLVTHTSPLVKKVLSKYFDSQT